MLDHLMQDRFLLELIYTIVVVVSSVLIVARVGRLYALSGHEGLKHFRNAFILFGIAFLLRFCFQLFPKHELIIFILFGYTILIAAVYLLHSVVWKERGTAWLWLMHPLVLLVPLLDIFFKTELFLYLFAIGLFAYGIIISLRLYRGTKAGQLYLMTMVLFFVGWTIHFFGALLDARFPWIILYVDVIGMAIMILFVIGIYRRHC